MDCVIIVLAALIALWPATPAVGQPTAPATQPTTRPTWTVPEFVIAVDQQPVALLEQWKVLGCNTLWGIGAGEDQTAWVREANRLGLYQVRPPVGDPAIDPCNPLLLAWLHGDEPDLKGITADRLAAIRAGPDKAATVRAVPWALNLSGGLLSGLVKPAALHVPAPDYRALCAQADWLSQDVYPVAGWNLAAGADLFAPFRLTRQLQRDNPGKEIFVYVEMSRQGLGWLPGGGRCSSVAEFKVQLRAARKAKVRGIILFPECVQDQAFQWDASPAELKQALIEFAESLR